jgi:desulfoferrodoxin (superoxide reductase-like protein)
MRRAKFQVTFSRHNRSDAVAAFHHKNIEGLWERRNTVKNVESYYF